MNEFEKLFNMELEKTPGSREMWELFFGKAEALDIRELTGVTAASEDNDIETAAEAYYGLIKSIYAGKPASAEIDKNDYFTIILDSSPHDLDMLILRDDADNIARMHEIGEIVNEYNLDACQKKLNEKIMRDFVQQII